MFYDVVSSAVRCMMKWCFHSSQVGVKVVGAGWTFCRIPFDFKSWNWVSRERNVLFNDALNTFYLRLYGIRHMVKDHSDSEKGSPLPPHRLLLSINSKGSFICTIPHDRITHTTTFVTPVVEHWLEREIAQWVHPVKDRSDDPSHHERTLYLWATSRSLEFQKQFMHLKLFFTICLMPYNRR